jgi:hypothetical protein
MSLDPCDCPDHCPQGIGADCCPAFNQGLPLPLRALFQRLCHVNRDSEASPGLRKLCAHYRQECQDILEHLESHPGEKMTVDEWHELESICADMRETILTEIEPGSTDREVVDHFWQSMEKFRPAGV